MTFSVTGECSCFFADLYGHGFTGLTVFVYKRKRQC